MQGEELRESENREETSSEGMAGDEHSRGEGHGKFFQ